MSLAAHTDPMTDVFHSKPARLALIGDRSPLVQAHARMPDILDALDSDAGPAIDAYWIETVHVAETDLSGFDGIWLLPGSPYASTEGAVSAVRFAREASVPFL